MKDAPLISIIVPIYNSEAFLRATLNSIAAQTYPNLDVVLVDDGSTDGSLAICQEYAAAHPGFHVVHRPNGGPSAARNTGLAAAKGEYIAWIDSDDTFEPEAISLLYDALQQHGKRIAMCNYRNVRPDGSTSLRYSFAEPFRAFTREEMMGLCLGIVVPNSVCCTLIGRPLYEGIAFPEGKLFEDVLITWKLQERSNGAVILSQPLINRVVRTDGLSSAPRVSNRVQANMAYIARYREAVQRWPQYDRAMLVSSARLLRMVRDRVVRRPRAEYDELRGEIREICAFYREHTPQIVPKDTHPLARLEYWMITSGSYPWFILSRALCKLTGHPDSWIRSFRTPDVPEL